MTESDRIRRQAALTEAEAAKLMADAALLREMADDLEMEN